MKKIVLTTALLSSIVAVASAQDMPQRQGGESGARITRPMMLPPQMAKGGDSKQGEMRQGTGDMPQFATGDQALDEKVKALMKERDAKIKAIFDDYQAQIKKLLGDKKPIMASGTPPMRAMRGDDMRPMMKNASGTQMMRKDAPYGNGQQGRPAMMGAGEEGQQGIGQPQAQGVVGKVQGFFRGFFGGNRGAQGEGGEGEGQ